MALTAAQRGVLSAFNRAANDLGASPKERKALVESGLVESNLQNLSYGDRDSLGALQQRPSSGYRNALDPYKAAKDFLVRARQANRPGTSAGTLAQSVQRSAFPARYDQQSARAASLLGQPSASGARTRTIPGTDNSAQRAALISNFLTDKNPDTLDFALGIRALKDTPATTTQIGARGASGGLKAVMGRANALNRQHLPYQWGGGHGSTAPGQPLDCSGAVSKVLGINPRVSGQFASWGAPGQGKNVTIYANQQHVLMEINGHFWGTSASNPGGGAGWIPRSAISPAYLKNFTARHPPGE